MRARYPDREGFVDRDGLPLFYEVYDNEEPTIVLVPTTTIWHSRQWKAQIPYLARHFRVVAFDGRGNGRSGKPHRVEAYRQDLLADDIVAVMDATSTNRGVLVALCHAVPWILRVAVELPDRVSGLIAVAPGVDHIAPAQPHYVRAAERWTDIFDTYEGWEMCNRHFWLTRYEEWLDFFFSELLPEVHTTKQHEDAMAWGLGTSGVVRVAEIAARDAGSPGPGETRELCAAITQPVMVIHGDLDECQAIERGRALAELTKAELVVLEGVGHALQAREPVQFNMAVKDFVERNAQMMRRLP